MRTRNFRELSEAMPQESRQRVEQRFEESLASMPPDELKRMREMAQLYLSERFGVQQSENTQIEHRPDISVSLLSDYVEALDGRLEIRAVFPDREVLITHSQI